MAAPQLDQAFDADFRDGRWTATLSRQEAAPRLDPAEAGALRDWHNDYAALLLDLRTALRRETDDRRRRELLGEVRRLIDDHHGSQATGSKRSPAIASRS
jgi:hypothetical protein